VQDLIAPQNFLYRGRPEAMCIDNIAASHKIVHPGDDDDGDSDGWKDFFEKVWKMGKRNIYCGVHSQVVGVVTDPICLVENSTHILPATVSTKHPVGHIAARILRDKSVLCTNVASAAFWGPFAITVAPITSMALRTVGTRHCFMVTAAD
jgi:hypothetical protein